MIRIERVVNELPAGFELLRYAADAEAFDMLAVLAREWQSGENRFDRPGEALVAAYDGTLLAGMGAMTIDPHLDGALRMRRFYVRPHYRRKGVGGLLARALLDRPEIKGRLITLNAPRVEAARFWEALGFVHAPEHSHTHVRHGNYVHA